MDIQTKPLARNIVALFIIQASNYLLPLLAIPYLVRVLGADLFGVVAFGTALVAICCLLTDFGFNLSATYSLSRNRGDRLKLIEITNAVLVCKLLLLFIVLLCAAIFICLFPKYQEHSTFLWLMLIAVVGQSFQPVWFFQGLERMSYITGYTVIVRILYITLILLLVKEPSDYHLVAISLGLSSTIGAVVSLMLMFKLGYRVSKPELRVVRQVFVESANFFWARAAVSTYSSGATFALGLTAAPIQLAHYSAAEQLYKGGQSAFLPVSQALYPMMARTRNIRLFSFVFRAVAISALLGVIASLFLGEWIIRLVFGPDFVESFPVLLVFMATLAISAPSTLLGYPLLAAVGQLKYANRSVLFGGAIQVILLAAIFALGHSSAMTVALAVLAAEMTVLVVRIYYSSTQAGIGPAALLLGRTPCKPE